MTNEEQLVSNYEHNRRDRLRSVIADYLGDAGVTAQVIIDEFKAELNSQLDYYRQKVDKVSDAVNLLDTHHNGTYPVTITPDDITLTGAGNTAAYPTATYFVDGHSDVHVSIADTTAEVFNIDTTLHGEVSVASSDTGYYDHDLAGAYYVPPTVDYTNPNPDVATDPVSYTTESNVAVASSETDPAGNYGAGGISPAEQAGEDRPQYGKHGNFQDNFPPRS
jgi:hypothetical protein